MGTAVCHNVPCYFIYPQRKLQRYPKKEEVVQMDNSYAKRTVALPSRESK
jgi:hypothetical protein